MSAAIAEPLPIDQLKDAFHRALGETRPLVVVAPTGAGKSTRLPLWLWRASRGPVLVVEPRRVACRSLASFLAQHLGEALGETVGYRVRFEDISSTRTRLLFATPGVALRMLSSAAFAYQVVVLDEFHERSWELDLLAASLRWHIQREAIKAKLVVTSATIDGQQLAAELDGTLLASQGRSYPVSIEHAEQPMVPSSHNLPQRVASALPSVLQRAESGDVLVFLPGKGEIRAVATSLAHLARQHRFRVYPVHGSLPTHALTALFSGAACERRVFLATNVAETALTIPSITAVIDSGLARTRLHRAGRAALALTPIAQSAMDQRAGRAGRVAPGFCVRLWNKMYAPQPRTPPEVERIELDELVLQAAANGLAGDALRHAPWLSSPPEFALNAAVTRLQALGALDAQGQLTAAGRQLAQMPVAAHQARLLAEVPGELRASIADLVALLERRAELELPVNGKQAEAVRQARAELLNGCDNEVYAELIKLRRGQAETHALNPTSLRETRRSARQLRRLVGARPDAPEQDETPLPPPETLSWFVLQRWPEAAFARRRGNSNKPPSKSAAEKWANGREEVLVNPFSAPSGEPNRRRPLTALVLETEWLAEKGTGVQGRGRLLLPCPPEQPVALGLTTATPKQPRLERTGDDVRILADVEHSLAGVCLQAEQTELTDAALRAALVELITQQTLFPGLAKAVEEDLHLLRLLREWPAASEQTSLSLPAAIPDSPEAFVRQQLDALGVEQAADLSVLQADDLRPPLSHWTGLAQWELQRLRDTFPRYWTHQGAHYRCELNPARRRVILVPLDKTARRRQEPVAKTVPRFGGFAVYFDKGGSRVKIR